MSRRMIFHVALWGALVFVPATILAQMAPEESFAASGDGSAMDAAAATSSSPDSSLYAEGTRAINDSRWAEAEAAFSKAAAQHGDHAAGAFYWKAYAQNKQGETQAALASCAELKREFVSSNWVHECGALEIEIQAKIGKPVEPSGLKDDDLKLLALASLMQKDEPNALAELQEILNSDANEQLKKKAMFILGQHYSDATYAQIVRIRYVDGDVRIARGEQNEKPEGATWEQASSDVPLETGYSLVTGNGRAEIELEDSSMVYLGENSVLTFNDLHTTSGVPYTEVALLSGVASVAIKPYITGSAFILKTPTDIISVKYPHTALIRVNSYLDGMTVTSQENDGLHFSQLTPKPLSKGQVVTLHHGQLSGPTGPDNPDAFADWDKWVADRFAQRTAAMAEVMKAAGLTAPLPGLADMKGQGRFFACAPYGTCWEPTPAPERQQAARQRYEPGSSSNMDGRQSAHFMEASLTRYRSFPAQVSPSLPLWDSGLPEMEDAFLPCIPPYVGYGLQRDSFTGVAMVVQPGSPQARWNWAVCHGGAFIQQRNHYVWWAGPKRHHVPPCHWVKSGHTVGLVPTHPYDVLGRPPINRKEDVFAVSKKDGASLERVRFQPGHAIDVLQSPPREFRNEHLRPLPGAGTPRMEVHSMRQAPAGDKSPVAESRAIPLQFDAKSQNFMMSKEEMHEGKSITVSTPLSNREGTLQARGGNFAGGHGGFGGGDNGHGGAASGGGGFHGAGSSASGGSHAGGGAGGGATTGGGIGGGGGGSHGGGSGSSGANSGGSGGAHH
jgi:hypothetical protein